MRSKKTAVLLYHRRSFIEQRTLVRSFNGKVIKHLLIQLLFGIAPTKERTVIVFCGGLSLLSSLLCLSCCVFLRFVGWWWLAGCWCLEIRKIYTHNKYLLRVSSFFFLVKQSELSSLLSQQQSKGDTMQDEAGCCWESKEINVKHCWSSSPACLACMLVGCVMLLFVAMLLLHACQQRRRQTTPMMIRNHRHTG